MSNVATREVICSGCSTLLRFPAGAQVVRCVLCSQITPAEPTRQPSHQVEQRQSRWLSLSLFSFSRPSQRKPSRLTRSIFPHNPAPVAATSHLICGGCRTVLAYPTGASSVRCAVCTTINQLSSQNTMASCRYVIPEAKDRVPSPLLTSQPRPRLSSPPLPPSPGARAATPTSCTSPAPRA